MTPQKWADATGAIGIVSKAGRYGGTYAHKEIAFEFASWISVEFKLYLVKEFERLKTEEMKQLGWDIKRNLAKINYRIHTDAIKENLIPPELSARQISLVYANEADVLNMALFGMTAKQWRDANLDLKGNIRDYANVSQLVCLSNLENLNAVFINEEIPQAERLAKLNAIAISQMKVLTEDHRILQLEDKEDTELPRTTDENWYRVEQLKSAEYSLRAGGKLGTEKGQEILNPLQLKGFQNIQIEATWQVSKAVQKEQFSIFFIALCYNFL